MKLTELERREFSRYLERFDFLSRVRGKTFLITGSKGIVGSGLIKWLLLLNETRGADVNIIASTRDPATRPAYLEAGDPIEFCAFGHERAFCARRNVDYVVHAATSTDNSFHAAHPAQSLRVILDGTETMLDLCREHSGCGMIYISSEEVYGLTQTETPLPESFVGAIDSLRPRSCYPLGKKAAELLCRNYFQEYGTRTTIVRPTSLQGLLQPYQEERVVNEIFRCLAENRNLVLKSAGLTKKCLMYSLDALSAVFTVLFDGESGEAYNATNPDTFLTVRDLAERLFRRFRPNLAVEVPQNDTAVAEGYLPRRTVVQDITKIKKLGWVPLTDLETIYSIDLERFGVKL